jgi:hypothetical protein
VRAPGPCRPAKFRFEVDAQRSPAGTLSGVHRQAHRAAGLAPFEAGFGEDAVEPFGFCLPLDEAGARHDQRLLDAGVDPAAATTSAAWRRSSMRLFVQLPMKICSILTSSSARRP